MPRAGSKLVPPIQESSQSIDCASAALAGWRTPDPSRTLPRVNRRTLGKKGLRSRRSASAAWACRSSTARATTTSRSRRSIARSSSARLSSTRPTCTGRSAERGAGRPRDPRPARRRSSSPPSSASCATPDGAAARHQRQARLRAAGCEASLRRLGVDDDRPLLPAPRRSERRRSRRPSARWRRWSSEGKVRYLGLSEAGAGDAPPRARRPSDRRAADRVLAVERAIRRTASSPRCRELGIGFVAYSPLGRGFLTGEIQALRGPRRGRLPAHVTRASRARTSSKNLELVARIRDARRGEGRARRRSSRSPGCSRRATTSCRSPAPSGASYLEENVGALDVELSADDLARIDEAAPKGVAAGTRYPAPMMQWLNH